MHRTTIVKYTKFSAKELKKSANDPLSCVAEIQSNEILSLRPRDCEQIVKGVRRCVMDKIGRYHLKVDGIVLGYAKIRIENPLSAIRMDSPYLHVRATIDYYVFHPRLGSTLRGTVNYVSKEFVSAMIYQVFNVTVKLNGNVNDGTVEKGREISFIVKSCDMRSEIPIIDGELITDGTMRTKVEPFDHEQTDEDLESTSHQEVHSTNGDLNGNEDTKIKKSKKNKHKLHEPEESQHETNGRIKTEGEEKLSVESTKDELIQSLLADIFAEMNEVPADSEKRKSKSKKTPKSNTEQPPNADPSPRRSFNQREDLQHFYQNCTSTPLDAGEQSHSKKRKIRFDLNDTITFIKSEPNE